MSTKRAPALSTTSPRYHAALGWDDPLDHTAPVLTHRAQQYAPRRYAWLDRAGGLLVLPGGVHEPWESGRPLSDLLAYLCGLIAQYRPHVLMVCGGTTSLNTPSAAELREPSQRGWQVGMRYSEERGLIRSHVRYSRGESAIELRLTGEWFGDCSDAPLCAEAWHRLNSELRRAFDSHATAISTPARTGMDLLERSLPYGRQYPVLRPELRELLHANNGQGRLEVLAPAGVESYDRLYQLDGRWMYAACLHALPNGAPVYDQTPAYLPYVPGFYFVTARVPAGWEHIGLVPRLTLQSDGETRREWPTKPGTAFAAWVTGAELAVAQEHGWRITIRERFLWPASKQSDPAKTWITKLRSLRAHAELNAAEGDRAARLLVGAYRAIVLNAVGLWHRTGAYEQHYLPAAEARSGSVSAVAFDLHVRDGILSYKTPTPPADLRYSHPEWSATVWGRARARLAAAALTLPRGSLAAVRSDAIWLDHDPHWLDDGRPGTFRLKSIIAGPVPAPRTNAAMLALLPRARSVRPFESGEE